MLRIRRLLLTFLLLAACSVSPGAADAYSCTLRSIYYGPPSFVQYPGWHDVLSVDTPYGTFHCFTKEAPTADAFIAAQETLLRFLSEHGTDAQPLTYYAASDGDCFSDSENAAAHISLCCAQTSRQVLVTLQALWGDYTDYGYLYALSNTIAGYLGWTQDLPESADPSCLADFFACHPDLLSLPYPCFSSDYASEQTIRCCQTLSMQLLTELDLHRLLSLSPAEQLQAYSERLNSFAQAHDLPTPHSPCRYAYGGAALPLRIQTTYAELVIERGYTDYYASTFGDYFGHAETILQTASVIDREISAAVQRFALEDEAGMIRINWLSGSTAQARFGSALTNHYAPAAQEVSVTSLQGYLHEYHHHLEHLLSPTLSGQWQSQAFCELGRAHSVYAQQPMWEAFMHSERWAEMFTRLTGRACQPTLEDYYECYDILCFITGETTLDYHAGRNAINSFCHYLISQYGEATAFALMLHPENAQALTGQEWPALIDAWQLHLQSKYASAQPLPPT